MPILRQKISLLPPRLEGLAALATNLTWSWNREARQMFREIDPPLWRETRQNPIALLREVAPSRLELLAKSPEFLATYDRLVEWFSSDQRTQGTWFERRYPKLMARPVAYFCAEFGFHNSVPIYSGGLGILAGDHCKAASDLGLPLVGVGLSYMKGYFDQRLRADGWQEDSDDHVDPTLTPLVELRGPHGEPYLATVNTFGRPVQVRVWTMKVGRMSLYLLDTNLDENDPEDRTLLSKLYAGGPDLRLRQEWLLGVGGVRVLRAVGVDPAVWHANEGHASFMLLERLRELTTKGVRFAEALQQVRASSIFTTHTPVPAGHDAFDLDHLAACSGPMWEELGIDKETFLALGQSPIGDDRRFQMTVLALRSAGRVNGVSERHGQVTRRIWNPLWPDHLEDQVPIRSVTNGVHLATWMANEIMAVLDRRIGPDWGNRFDDPALFEQIRFLDPRDLWETHKTLKGTLMGFVREEARKRFAAEWKEANQVVAAGTLLHPYALTIGFARRFATYKRASLLFSDLDRLRRLLCNKRRPVQIIFSGKAHPADDPGKAVLQQVFKLAHDPSFEGRVAFLEDYDMYLARSMVQGVDLWMNLPRVPLEACGTSGMKAALNAIPQLATIDGWWEEAYDGTNGWAVPYPPDLFDAAGADASDADHVYRLLEEEVVPMYYHRDDGDVPHAFVDRMRNALRVGLERFTARRMLLAYIEGYYVPAMRGDPFDDVPPAT